MIQEIKHIPLKVGGRDIMADIANMPMGMMVAVRGICEAIGLDSKSQRRKIEADPRFNWGHMTSVAEDEKTRDMLCLPVEQIVPWLFTINSNKVTKPEVKETLLAFQKHLGKELYAVAIGQISCEKTARLEQQMSEVLQQIREIQSDNKEIRAENSSLRQEVSYLRAALSEQSEMDASCAGKQLAARKRHLSIA